MYLYIKIYVLYIRPTSFQTTDQVHGGTTFANHALGMLDESEDVGDAKMKITAGLGSPPITPFSYNIC